MSSSFPGGGFGSHGFGGGRAGSGQPLADAFDQLRAKFEHRAGPRMARGDVRAAVLALLAEKPMHGYQIIAEIEQRSGGAWKPSAGSVYPTLQLLADEGLISAAEGDGRKTYSLTEAGQAEADASADRAAPWEASGPRDLPGMGALPKAAMELAQAAAQLRRTGTPEQVKQAVTVLDETRRKLYSILAQD
ncbi:PadR family transcriptional regulator [Gryllotalpicola sp.]|uniref:PadR family transcriptional regulator n=1 Tax=Gryllotalpicola sp. TaxID=1932787 RepID=UPI00261AEFCE|nr:PadR family transcriptional regulator [Gryllotalpicola sp.]